MALSIDFRGSVSFPPGYPSYRTLTFVLVGLTPTEYTSLRWTYVESSSCLYSSGYTLYGLPSGRRTACAPSCRYPEPRRSISRWLPPILAAACTAAPATVGWPRCRAERPGTARRYTAAGAATRPGFPSAWARAAETACDAVARNPRSTPAPS